MKLKEMNEMAEYRDALTDKVVGEVHLIRRPDGSIGASGLFDPKRLFVHGAWVRRITGEDDAWRDLTTLIPERFPFYYISKLYGWYRRKCCKDLGPEKDAELATIRTPQIRKWLFLFELGSQQ